MGPIVFIEQKLMGRVGGAQKKGETAIIYSWRVGPERKKIIQTPLSLHMKELGKLEGKDTLPGIYIRFAKQSLRLLRAKPQSWNLILTTEVFPWLQGGWWLDIQRKPSEDDIYVGWSQRMKMMKMMMMMMNGMMVLMNMFGAGVMCCSWRWSLTGWCPGAHHLPQCCRAAARGIERRDRWRCGGADVPGILLLHVPGSKLLVLGMVIQPLIGNPYNGYINPYYWVDDHPLLYGNIGSLDTSTHDLHAFFLRDKNRIKDDKRQIEEKGGWWGSGRLGGLRVTIEVGMYVNEMKSFFFQ